MAGIRERIFDFEWKTYLYCLLTGFFIFYDRISGSVLNMIFLAPFIGFLILFWGKIFIAINRTEGRFNKAGRD